MGRRRTNSIYQTEKVVSPLFDALDAKKRGKSIFDVLVTIGLVAALVAVVSMGVLIWILPQRFE